MKNKKWMSLACIAMALMMLASCGKTVSSSQVSSAPSSVSQASSAPVSEPAQGLSFTDSAGRTVELPAEITKVAPSGAFAQMLILALAPDLMVSLASPYTPEAQEFLGNDFSSLPVIGQFYGTDDLNLEEIAAIGPQLIIDMGETKKSAAEDMDSITTSIGVPAIHIEAKLENMGTAFRTLGKVLGREEKAEELALYCEKVLADTQEIMNKVGDEKVSLLYCLGDSGLNVIAQGSFHAETIDMLGDNLAVVDEPSSKGTGNEVNMEQLLLWNPQVILFGPGSAYDAVATDPAWQQMDAVKNGTYYEVPFGPYNWMGFPPSVNRYLGLLWGTALLYPEQVTFDLYERTAEYYKLFYHSELTREQFDALTANSLGKPAA